MGHSPLRKLLGSKEQLFKTINTQNINVNGSAHTVLKLKIKQVTYESKLNDNIKRPKPEENQLGILKIYTFCWKIQQRASGPGESAADVTYVSMRTYQKSY